MSRTKKIAVAAVLLAAATAGAGLARSRADDAARAAKVETAAVEQGDVVAKVTATGTVSALVTVQVGSQVSGRVAALYADFNSKVKKGQLIAKIDPELFDAAVEQARANETAAQANVAKAQAQAEDAARQAARSKALVDQQLVAAADYDTAQSNAAAAQAQVKAAQGAVAQARAALHQAEVNLAYTRIVSPTDGVVISRSVDVGQTVAASLQAPTLFTIAEDLSKMQVDTSVGEADVGRLQPGMPATFTVDAYPGQTFQGAVRQIRNAPQTVQNVVTYDAVVDVSNPELKLKPGMTANVTFVYAEKDGVLRVPNAALRFRPPAGFAAAPGAGAGARNAAASGGRDARTVYALRGGQPVALAIRTGLSDGTATEVVAGDLRAGDRVVTDAAGAGAGAAAGGRTGGGPGPGGAMNLRRGL
jgi:HlyD family secretion protein